MPGEGRMLAAAGTFAGSWDDGRIYVAGGCSLHPDAKGAAERTYLKSTLCYNPSTNTWSTAPDMPETIVAPATPMPSHKGELLLLCGDPGHREICGIIGQNGAPDKITVLKNMDDAEQFQPEPGCRYALLSQTTWDSEQLAEMIASLQRRIPDLNVCGNVCHATNDRQNAVRTLAEQADVILIAGSPSSSNTLRLLEVAERSCGRAFLIAGAGNLTAEMICGAEVIGIASGASAPESLVRGIAAAVENLP